MFREHPLRIVRYSIKNIWLLIFPLLRGFWEVYRSGEKLPHEVFRSWLRGTGFDLLVLLCILGFGWLRWYCCTFTVEHDEIHVREGFAYRRTRLLPVRNIATVSLEYPFWLRPFSAVYLYADTAAGVLNMTDLRLLLRKQDVRLFTDRMPKLRQSERHGFRHRAGWMRILLFSVLFSSSFSGSFYVAAFWFQGGRITEQILEELQVAQKLNEVSEKVASRLAGIPPAAVTLALLIMLSWLVSFLFNLFRYGKFSLVSDKQTIIIHSGILTKQHCILRSRKIDYLDIRQNLITKIAGIFSLHIRCPGFGSQKGSQPICLPLLTRRELEHTLPMLFTGARLFPNSVSPPWTSAWAYIWKPVILGAAVLPVMHLVVEALPQAASLLGFLRFMLLIPIVWKLIIQIMALFTSGISISGGHVCMRYCKRFTFHTILAETDSITKVRIMQNPIQKLFHTCHVTVYFRSQTPERCTLYAIQYETAKAFFQ